MSTQPLDRVCAVDSCAQRRHARGWCCHHYKKWQTWGTPTPTPLTTSERFFSHVTEQPDGCWIWDHTDRGGYGTYFFPNGVGSHVLPHRWSYEYFRAEIPDGLVIDHLCSNRACVNPEHLEPVPTRQNLLRSENYIGVNARKTHCVRGHEFTEENTYRPPSRPDRRLCRTCIKIRDRKARRRAAVERK